MKVTIKPYNEKSLGALTPSTHSADSPLTFNVSALRFSDWTYY